MKTIKSFIIIALLALSFTSNAQNIIGNPCYKQIVKNENIASVTSKVYYLTTSYQYDMFVTIKIDSLTSGAQHPYMECYVSNNGVDYALYKTVDSITTNTVMYKEYTNFGFKYMKLYFKRNSATKCYVSINVNAYKK